jgi:hypothetical protein
MYQAMTLERRGLRRDARERLVAAKSVALEPTVAHLRSFVERGEIPAWSPTLLDVVLLGAAHEALRRWLAGADDLDPGTLRKVLPALAWRSIGA